VIGVSHFAYWFLYLNSKFKIFIKFIIKNKYEYKKDELDNNMYILQPNKRFEYYNIWSNISIPLFPRHSISDSGFHVLFTGIRIQQHKFSTFDRVQRSKGVEYSDVCLLAAEFCPPIAVE
jgi:hypothetical protein